VLVISATDYTDLWDGCNPPIQNSELNDDRDVTISCPECLGRGYERSIELRGMELLLIDRTYDDDLRIVMAEPEDRCIEFGFNLAGTSANRSSGSGHQWPSELGRKIKVRYLFWC
jgi:hypothetical protein